jgi:hypothetical protein
MKHKSLIAGLFFLAGALALFAELIDVVRGQPVHLSTAAAGLFFLALGESYRRRPNHRPESS